LEIDDVSLVQEPLAKDLATADVDPRIDSPSAQTIGRGHASDLAGQRAASLREISAGPGGRPAANPIEELPAAAASFDISTLQPEEQDLHRRANRVAKVSMQDIKMLRPNDVRLGREHKDICLRLRDDIDKANKEYERRFQSDLGLASPMEQQATTQKRTAAKKKSSVTLARPPIATSLAEQQLERLARDLHEHPAGTAYERLVQFAEREKGTAIGARAALALGYYDYTRAHFTEARSWFEKAAADPLLPDYAMFWEAQNDRAAGAVDIALVELKRYRERYPDNAMSDS